MLFGKYHIVVLREGRSGSRNLRLHGLLPFLLFVLFIALVAGNIWLLREWFASRHMGENLANAQRVIEEQRRQFVSLAGRITAVSQDLQRVQRFDSKLRLMMNMEKDPAEVVGSAPGDFSRSWLPMHRQELAVRKMQEFLASLGEATRLEEVAQQDLLRVLRENRTALSATPSIWPVNGFVTSSFGGRNSPFGMGRQFHKGLDISNRPGTPIVATAQGTVIQSGVDGAYGISVEVDHGGGIVTKYGHMLRSSVNNGQWVRRGQVIGQVGMTGRATGPHLHYEVRLNGVPVNPMRYILE